MRMKIKIVLISNFGLRFDNLVNKYNQDFNFSSFLYKSKKFETVKLRQKKLKVFYLKLNLLTF